MGTTVLQSIQSARTLIFLFGYIPHQNEMHKHSPLVTM